MDNPPSFHLSHQFLAHENDVKAVVATSERHLVTSSRDDTCKLWVESEDGYKQQAIFNNQQQVNSLEFYEASNGHEYIIAGRKDGSIAFFSSTQADPVAVVPIHKINVCALKLNSQTGQLISASWDTTAAVLDVKLAVEGKDSQLYHLQGHTYSVWAVAFVPNKPDHYVTGAADRTLKIWNGSQNIKTIEDHEDVIRSILFLNETTFLTAANDSAIRIFNLDSDKAIEKYESTHGEFYYSLTQTTLPNGFKFIVASSEKGYVDFYQTIDDALLIPTQSIRIPAMSLWSVTSTVASEVCVASNTGFVYIFSANPEKKATEALQHALDVELAAFVAKEVAERAAQDSDQVTIKVSLDDTGKQLDLVYVKGTDPADAAETFIKNYGLPFSYLNEIVEYIQVNVSEAKNFKQYKQSKTARIQRPGKADYEFEMSKGENEKFFLSYNVGEDPMMAAQLCCDKNQLPIAFIPLLVKHLNENVPELQGLKGSAYTDPFTGGGRYVPGDSTAADGQYGDPFTSSGRYIPSAQPSDQGFSSGGDPFTSGGRYIPGQAPTTHASHNVDKKRPRSEFVPIKDFFLFNDKAGDKVVETLKKANEEVPEEFKLEEPLLDALVQILSPFFKYNEIQTLALEKALTWPIDQVFCIVDVFRYAVLNLTHNQIFFSQPQTLTVLLQLLISDPSFKVKTFVCRAIANALKHEPARKLVFGHLSEVLEAITSQIFSEKGVLQIAAVSCVANLAFCALSQTEAGVAELGPREDILRALIKSSEPIQSFSFITQPTLLRLLQAIVTTMWGDATVIKMGQQRGISEIVQRIKDSVAEEDGKGIARDIYVMTLEV